MAHLSGENGAFSDGTLSRVDTFENAGFRVAVWTEKMETFGNQDEKQGGGKYIFTALYVLRFY